MEEVKIEKLGGNCPVQAEGLIDGEPFYFRARWDSWSLSIGSDFEAESRYGIHGRDVVGQPRWHYDEEWGDDQFSAGWMPEGVAREMIDKGAALYREAKAKPPSSPDRGL